jgi:hypothetical protein
MPIVDPPAPGSNNPFKRSNAPSYDYGSWDHDIYEYGKRDPVIRANDRPTNIEVEMIHRLEMITRSLAIITRKLEESDAEKEFLRLRCLELERALNQHSKSQVPGG